MQITHSENNYARITQKITQRPGKRAILPELRKKIRKLRKNYANYASAKKLRRLRTPHFADDWVPVTRRRREIGSYQCQHCGSEPRVTMQARNLLGHHWISVPVNPRSRTCKENCAIRHQQSGGCVICVIFWRLRNLRNFCVICVLIFAYFAYFLRNSGKMARFPGRGVIFA